jgi:hypothetical protein
MGRLKSKSDFALVVDVQTSHEFHIYSLDGRPQKLRILYDGSVYIAYATEGTPMPLSRTQT